MDVKGSSHDLIRSTVLAFSYFCVVTSLSCKHITGVATMQLTEVAGKNNIQVI
jgi:hypothetical protein